MKNSQRTFSSAKSEFEINIAENSRLKPHSSNKAVTSTMTEQLAIPPARVWEKIERILDEQDNRREMANKIISSSFRTRESKTRSKNFYFATVAGVSLLAGLIGLFHKSF